MDDAPVDQTTIGAEMRLDALRRAQKNIHDLVNTAIRLRDEVNPKARNGQIIIDPDIVFCKNHATHAMNLCDNFRAAIVEFAK